MTIVGILFKFFSLFKILLKIIYLFILHIYLFKYEGEKGERKKQGERSLGNMVGRGSKVETD